MFKILNYVFAALLEISKHNFIVHEVSCNWQSLLLFGASMISLT